MTSVTTFAPPTLFNLHTGAITSAFKRQLDLCGIQPKQHISDLASYHIKNVDRELQSNGCFQTDCDFYKKGGTSKLKLTYEQAVDFLEDEYRDRPQVLPRLKVACDAIVPCGVETTMHKRFDALQLAAAHGSRFPAIHFIAKDQDTVEMVQAMIKDKYSSSLGTSKIDFVVANTNLNVLETGLASLNRQGELSDRYVLVTDILFASKIEGVAQPILKGKTCLGVAASSIKDWQEDMHLYGYEEALGSKEKAVVAFASSALNFKARQVHSELQVYRDNKLKSEKRKFATILAIVGLALLINYFFKKIQST